MYVWINVFLGFMLSFSQDNKNKSGQIVHTGPLICLQFWRFCDLDLKGQKEFEEINVCIVFWHINNNAADVFWGLSELCLCVALLAALTS